MKLFDVYPLYNINIVKGDGCKVWDENGTEYLDLYGGHAVISIGHAHPHYPGVFNVISLGVPRYSIFVYPICKSLMLAALLSTFI